MKLSIELETNPRLRYRGSSNSLLLGELISGNELQKISTVTDVKDTFLSYSREERFCVVDDALVGLIVLVDEQLRPTVW